MLKLENIFVKKGKEEILDNINLTVQKKDKILILGESGSGKSTLLKTIILFEKLDKGKIHFNNEMIKADNIQKYRRNFLYIGQKAPSFYGTVKQFLCLPFTFKNNHHVKPADAVINKFITEFSFSESICGKNFEDLSGGEQQRITIIQSLLLDRDILLLDEITSNLDKHNARKVIAKIMGFANKTVIIVSHNALWQEHVTRMYKLENKQLYPIEKMK